jgi:glycerol-3-phosphate acyltransferase PlsX
LGIKVVEYKLSVDAMGGDYGLKTTIPASILSLKKFQNLHIYLVGRKKDIRNYLCSRSFKYDNNRLSIVDAPEVVDMDESPISALRHKKCSSMRVAIDMVKNAQVSACISAGNTGALMSISKFVLKTIPGIYRPAIVYAIPSLKKEKHYLGSVYMLDLGANVNCSASQLFQFGVMGSILAANIKKKIFPSVALLNIGSEEIKGLDNIKQAASLLQRSSCINYIGYVEGSEIFESKADVIICDGFSGNVALKTSEGTANMVSSMMRNSFSKSFFSRVSGLCAKPILIEIKDQLNTNQYNGASLLGLSGIVIKSHGSASPLGFESAIYEAINEVKYNIPQKIKMHIEPFMLS